MELLKVLEQQMRMIEKEVRPLVEENERLKDHLRDKNALLAIYREKDPYTEIDSYKKRYYKTNNLLISFYLSDYYLKTLKYSL